MSETPSMSGKKRRRDTTVDLGRTEKMRRRLRRFDQLKHIPWIVGWVIFVVETIHPLGGSMHSFWGMIMVGIWATAASPILLFLDPVWVLLAPLSLIWIVTATAPVFVLSLRSYLWRIALAMLLGLVLALVPIWNQDWPSYSLTHIDLWLWLSAPPLVAVGFMLAAVDITHHFCPWLCPDCGYDLRGTFRGGRKVCPECGKHISPAQVQRFFRTAPSDKE